MTDNVSEICRDLATWSGEMEDLVATIAVVRAIRYTHAHTCGGDSATPRAQRYVEARDKLVKQRGRIRKYAYELAWRGRRLDGDPARFIGSRVDFAKANYPNWTRMVADLLDIHRDWRGRLERTRSDHMCPMCGQSRLYFHDDGKGLYCPACEYYGTPVEIRNARDWKIRQSDQWIDRATAARVYGLTRGAIRKHVHDGNLDTRDGLVHTVQLRDLPRRN